MNKLLRTTIPNNFSVNYGLFGFIIMCSGLLISGPAIYYNLKQTNLPQSSFVLPSIAPITAPETKSGYPDRIQIPSIGIDLAVADGIYNQDKGTWTLSDDKAHFAVVSSSPNDSYGNTYIYGHNRKSVFSHLEKLTPGAEVVILTKNNLRFVYKYTTVEETDPNNASVILPYSQTPTLSLQTCSGTWYQNRQIFRFNLERVETV